MSLEQTILKALEVRALSYTELSERLGSEVSIQELNNALYQLREQKMWVQKHPVMDGCKTCACSISYCWRLTLSGRQELAKQKGT
jgi:hypothetical protein